MLKKLKLVVLGLLLIPSLICADELMKVRINLFEGGQNSSDLSDAIQPNQATYARNVVLNRKNQLFKRKGQSLFNVDEGSTYWTGIGTYSPDSNTSYIVAASGQQVVRAASNATVWTVINPLNLLTAGKNTEFIQASNLLLILNGYDYTTAYDNISWDPGSSSASSPPTATTAAWLRNYLFFAGNPTNPDWLYFSNNLAPRTLTPTDILKINTGDGQKIVKISPFKLNELIIYKERSIFDLDITGTTPLTDWTLQPITVSIGCIAPRSVVNVGNDHWFLSNEPFAIRSLVRSSYDKLLIDMVSQPIQDIFDGTGEVVLNRVCAHKAAAVLYDNKYILAIPTGSSTYNDLVCVYDFITKSWYLINGWYPENWTVFENNLYYIDALDGRILKCFDNNIGDYASGPTVTPASPTMPITFEYRSKSIDFDNPENFKQLDALEVEFTSSGNYPVHCYVNLDKSGWQSIGDIELTDDVPTLPNTLPIALSSNNIARKTFQLQKFGQFKKIQVRFIQDGLTEECNLHSYTIFAKLLPWRRE